MSEKLMVGGQAVIEGVMMRGPKKVATAVREPSGKITVDVKPVNSLADKYPIFKKPFFRGILSLGESLVMGLKSLTYSAQMAGEEEADKLTNKDIAITMTFSLLAAIVLFIVIPTAAVNLVPTDDHVIMNMWEGFVRMAVFFIYIYAISRVKDIQRVFQYHGAEHKTIHAYEAGVELIPENVQKFSRLHPRCGTSFLLIVMVRCRNASAQNTTFQIRIPQFSQRVYYNCIPVQVQNSLYGFRQITGHKKPRKDNGMPRI